ncbi:hypothetical protein LPB72_17210 [Hydrogenophaga crassostreae]|uniref:HTH lysR-type domain-containing protein n=1 Tax=Hydrogenophaga crassostreae TaxID=1763535 RepID=A0A167GVK2_9BURK|nr:LysR family transcriptional regulator [Hydrogenophaga crassostreae]AOW12744.1 hypothetical protein LPB072_07715 [Hydrogenophaga crassostreae]OAD39933.1 hypothetical protein LPB72_17210 [Hydrogenophaga crassostreae]
MNHELRSWRFLVKVAEVGSVTRAAEQLHMTQPALSRHLQQLEESTGVELLMRHGRGVRLTPAGEHFRNVAEEILERMTTLSDELSARASEPTGEFAVGLPMSWAGLVTAELVPRFLRAFPKVKLRIMEGATPDLRRALNARQLQMAVILDTEQDAGVKLESLVDEGVYLVGNKSAGIPAGKRANFRMLAGQPLIQLPHETHLRVQVEKALEKLRITGDTLIEINSLNLLGFVEKGLGIAVLPTSAVESYVRKHDLSYTLMRDLTFSWCVATLRSRPRTAAMNEFETVLKQLLGDIVGRGLWPSARCTWAR